MDALPENLVRIARGYSKLIYDRTRERISSICDKQDLEQEVWLSFAEKGYLSDADNVPNSHLVVSARNACVAYIRYNTKGWVKGQQVNIISKDSPDFKEPEQRSKKSPNFNDRIALSQVVEKMPAQHQRYVKGIIDGKRGSEIYAVGYKHPKAFACKTRREVVSKAKECVNNKGIWGGSVSFPEERVWTIHPKTQKVIQIIPLGPASKMMFIEGAWEYQAGRWAVVCVRWYDKRRENIEKLLESFKQLGEV